MPNWTDDGSDECGCVMGRSCAYHAEEHARRRAETAAQMKAEGWGDNPDAPVPDELVPLLLELGSDDSLSENEKREIRRALFEKPTGGASVTPTPASAVSFEAFMRSLGLR